MSTKLRVVRYAVSLLPLAGVSVFAAVTKYAVHDMRRPRPPVVDPGTDLVQPPSDAIVLFDGDNLSEWTGKGGDASWTINDDGSMTVPRKAGDIRTRRHFGSCQLHIEWKTPEGVASDVNGQKRSNSGVFLMDKYEVQVLDSHSDDNYETIYTYADGQAGSIYGQHPPMVNACRPAGQWQVYDIAFMRPLFDSEGNCTRKARITVFHNGVCVHNNLEIEGTTAHKRKARYTAHDEGPIRLQDHGNPVSFRNIWIRELPEQPYLVE
jgi:hypothetical protein